MSIACDVLLYHIVNRDSNAITRYLAVDYTTGLAGKHRACLPMVRVVATANSRDANNPHSLAFGPQVLRGWEECDPADCYGIHPHQWGAQIAILPRKYSKKARVFFWPCPLGTVASALEFYPTSPIAMDPQPQPDAGQASQPDWSLQDGRFVAERQLSRWNNQTAWLGRDTKFDQPVFIRSAAGLSPTDDVATQLESELSSLRRLPNGLRPLVLELVHERNSLHVVRSFELGVPLSTQLRNGPLAIEDAIDIARQILATLAEVHQCGVIHGAVRPSNVILSPETGQLTLVDAGVVLNRAFVLSDQQSLDAALYASPEQSGALSRDIAETADVYSLGILLFECLTGRPPFQGEKIGGVILKHVTEAPQDVGTLRSETPRALNELVQRLLRKDPGDRTGCRAPRFHQTHP